MAIRQYAAPGVGYVLETQTIQYFVPGLGYLNDTSSASGSATGTITATLGTLTGSSVGTVTTVGTSSSTLGTLLASASGLTGQLGTASATLGALTGSSTGTVTSGSAGTLSATLGTLTGSSAGTVKTNGQLVATLGTLTVSATGNLTTGLTGTLAKTLGTLTVSAGGSTNVAIGTASGTLGTLTAGPGRGQVASWQYPGYTGSAQIGTSNAQLAQQISTLITAWTARETEFRNWTGGTAVGGPNANGLYPLTDGLGNSSLLPSPAKLADSVSGPATASAAARDAAVAAQTAAATSASAAASSATSAAAGVTAAQAARDLAQSYSTAAASSAAAALSYQGSAATSATAASTSQSAASTSATNAASSASAASTSATNAASSASAAATSAGLVNTTNFVARSGSTMTGALTTASALYIGNGSTRNSEIDLFYQTGGTTNFYLYNSGTAGQTLGVAYCNSSGVYAGTAFSVDKTAGAVTFNNTVSVTGAVTLYSGLAVNGSQSITDTSTNNIGTLVLSATSSSSGVGIRMFGNGSTTPSKALRVTGGTLQVVNDAYNAVIWQLGDDGSMFTTGGYVSNGRIQATGIGAIGQFEMPYGTYNAGWRNDGSSVYLLSSNTSGTPTSAGFNSFRPFSYNLANGTVTMDVPAGSSVNLTVGGVNKAYTASDGLHVADWLRVDAATGIYWQVYGGGWNMTDSTYIRSYSDKSVYAGTGSFIGAAMANTAGVQLTPRAWVKFAGSTTNGACTILKSYNVASVSRIAAGSYTVTFTNGMPDANYCVNCTAQTNGGSFGVGGLESGTPQTTSAVTVAVSTASNTRFDPPSCHVTIFG